MYKLPYELPNDIRLGILGNIDISGHGLLYNTAGYVALRGKN